MNIIKQIKNLRQIGNIIPLVIMTFISFILILVILSISYDRSLNELKEIIVTSEIESHKMRINSELMELARARTRLTSQILDTEDVFEQDELNLQLESYAGRFAMFRLQLLELDISEEEDKILKFNDSIVSTILPAQRKAVEMAMSDSDIDLQQANKILYETVLPAQGNMIESIGNMIALEQQRISELDKVASQLVANIRWKSNTLIGSVILAVIFLAFIVISRIWNIQYKLINSHVLMEQKVKNRTHELSITRDEMQNYIDIVDKHVITSNINSKGIITYASEEFCKISKYSKAELLGHHNNLVHHPDMPESLYVDIWLIIKQGKSWQGEIKNKAKDGSFYWIDADIDPEYNENREIIGYTAICQDITDKKRIEELSITDRLTQLYNRSKLDDALDYEINRANRYNNLLSVIMFDIDHFKQINDNFGHPIGDIVLVSIADITRKLLRNTDIAGRWGGEEFMVICPNTDLQGATHLAEKIRRTIASYHFQEAGHRTSSFGVATYKKDEEKASLLKRVDTLLYKAKENGRNRVDTEENM